MKLDPLSCCLIDPSLTWIYAGVEQVISHAIHVHKSLVLIICLMDSDNAIDSQDQQNKYTDEKGPEDTDRMFKDFSYVLVTM